MCNVPATLPQPLGGFLLSSQSIRWPVAVALLALATTSQAQGNGATTPAPISTVQPVVQLSAEQDHQRIMDLLHITSLRRGADGDPESPHAANYDESKANPYPNLPDPLLLKNGKRIAQPKAWWKKRRPEIVEDFDREIYGRVPANAPKVKWELISTSKEQNGDVPVITKKLLGHLDNSAYPLIKVDIQLTLSAPANANGPVPVMMEFGVSPEFLAAMAKRFTPEQLAAFNSTGLTWQQQVLARGWGYAVLIPTTVQADSGEGLTQGVIGLVNHGQPRKLDDWGVLRAWAWGASRGLDYFETDSSVDAQQVGIEGHSRYGKAALVAMAYDARFAVAYISSSGEGGANLYRRNFGEQIGNVAGTGEYHWMAGNFVKYAGPLTVNDLPVDSHELIALCAPRPVFIGAGATQGDGWVDAKGMFLAAADAGPVYKLLGKKDLGTSKFPPIETSLIDGDIAFRQHSGGHTPGRNWPTFLTFADRYLKGPALKTAASDSREDPHHEVALTFDDLPSHGPLPPGLTRVDIAQSIIHALQAAHAPPTYGFINAKKLENDPLNQQVLRLWRDAGFPLANHTFTHIDLNTNSVENFEQDLLANEPTLLALMADQDWHWLRFPYLHEGDTFAKHQAIEAFLKEHKYSVAQVTLSFGDYDYNEPYARCLLKNDTAAIEQLKRNYLDAAAQNLSEGQKMAELLYGHDIKHVMLLHVGGFQTVMLPHLLELLKNRGFKLISLEEAESDLAYTADPNMPGEWGGTFLDQMRIARHLTALAHPLDPEPNLEALCR